MGSGLGASLTTFSPSTTIQSSPANSNFSALNAAGVSNDGIITTSGGGVIQNVTGIAFVVGSLSRLWSATSVACINGKTTVNHSLGAKPDFVFITINAGSAPSSGLVVGYNPLTLSSTIVDLWANSLFNVDLLLIKF